MLTCVSCNGRGCESCRGTGQTRLTRCPKEVMTPLTSELFEYAETVRRSGLWPVAGGSLEQTPAFLTAERIVRSDRAAWRAHFGLDS